MKRKRIIIVIIVLGVLICPIGGYFYSQYFHKKVRNSPKMYPYQTYYGPPNQVLVIEDLQYKDALISFYDTLEKKPSASPIIELPLKTLPVDEVVYVMGYTDDGLLADVVSYYDRGGKFGGDYTRCWVYKKVLHKRPSISSRE